MATLKKMEERIKKLEERILIQEDQQRRFIIAVKTEIKAFRIFLNEKILIGRKEK